MKQDLSTTNRPALTPERRAHLSEIGKLGGQARAKQFTTASPASLSASGKKGFAVCAQRHGIDFATDRLAQWRAKPENHTCLVREVTGWLQARGVEILGFDLPLIPGKYYGDIVLNVCGQIVIVEADGEHWHQDREADRARDQAIAQAGFDHLIHLTGTDIESGDGKEKLFTYLEAICLRTPEGERSWVVMWWLKAKPAFAPRR